MGRPGNPRTLCPRCEKRRRAPLWCQPCGDAARHAQRTRRAAHPLDYTPYAHADPAAYITAATAYIDDLLAQQKETR